MMKKRKYSQRRIEATKTIATASQHIFHLSALKPGPVVLLCRESQRHQRQHLEHQEAELNLQLDRMGCEGIAVYKETASGWAEDRFKLELAAVRAKEAGAVLVAESTCRFIRGFRLKGTKKNVPPSILEFHRLKTLVDGARLATLLHPDTPENEVRKYQTKRGQTWSGNRGGRPKVQMTNKQRRKLKMPKALALHEAGRSYREIGKSLGVAWSTIRDWIKRSSGV